MNDNEKEKRLSTPVQEQETVINIQRSNEYAYIWTNDLTMYTRLDRLCKQSAAWECMEVHTIGGMVASKKYRVKKNMISFRGKVKEKPGENNTEELRGQEYTE